MEIFGLILLILLYMFMICIVYDTIKKLQEIKKEYIELNKIKKLLEEVDKELY